MHGSCQWYVIFQFIYEINDSSAFILLGTSYMFNSTLGNTHKSIPLHCPSKCGHRQFNATIISQSWLRNDSWYIQWLKSKGNRLYDLENQLSRPFLNGSVHDYALMHDHKRHLINDTSVLHFYFGKLRSEREKTVDPPATPSIFTLSKKV